MAYLPQVRVENSAGAVVDPATAQGVAAVETAVGAVGTAVAGGDATIAAEIAGLVDAVRQLVMLAPRGLTVDSANRLRVLLDTASVTLVYPNLISSQAAHLTLAFEGQQWANLRWQQQRAHLGV